MALFVWPALLPFAKHLPWNPRPALPPPRNRNRTPCRCPPSVARCKALVENSAFDAVILFVIVSNAVVLGLETYETLQESYGPVFDLVNHAILGIYVLELSIRLTAHGWNIRDFARDGWNVFDFVVVAAAALALLPRIPDTTTYVRLLRLVRILRIVRFLPELRIVMAAIGRGTRGVASLAGATVLLVYFYGMVGWAIFRGRDPNFVDIGQAMLTMFVMLTFSNLKDSIEKGQQLSDWTVLFYISYTVIVGFLSSTSSLA
jgi:voltage-gated sodium channel